MLPLVYSLYLSICGTENKLLRVCLVLLTAFWPNNVRSLPKHYLTWWKDLSSSGMWCSLYRNHKMCRSAKLMKWVGRQPEGAVGPEPQVSVRMSTGPVTCRGGAGGSSKTRQIWSRWQPSPRVSVSLSLSKATRQPTCWYNDAWEPP